MSNISDWFAWDCEGFKNQFVPFQGIMGTKNGNLWCQKPKKKGLYSQFQTSAAPLTSNFVHHPNFKTRIKYFEERALTYHEVKGAALVLI